jgi:hypothetical protein
MTASQLESIYQVKNVGKFQILLLNGADAMEFIDDCKKHQIPIAGMDAFLLTEAGVQPSLENSISCTAEGILSTDYRRIREHVGALTKRNYVFEVVV